MPNQRLVIMIFNKPGFQQKGSYFDSMLFSGDFFEPYRFGFSKLVSLFSPKRSPEEIMRTYPESQLKNCELTVYRLETVE